VLGAGVGALDPPPPHPVKNATSKSSSTDVCRQFLLTCSWKPSTMTGVAVQSCFWQLNRELLASYLYVKIHCLLIEAPKRRAVNSNSLNQPNSLSIQSLPQTKPARQHLLRNSKKAPKSAHQRKAYGTFMAQVPKYCQLPPSRNGPYARDCNLDLTAAKAAHHHEKIQKKIGELACQ